MGHGRTNKTGKMSFPLHAYIKQEKRRGGDISWPLYSTGRRQTSNRGPCINSVEQRRCRENRPIPGISRIGRETPLSRKCKRLPKYLHKMGGKRKAQSVGILLLYPRQNNANENALENVFIISLKKFRVTHATRQVGKQGSGS